MYYRFAKNNMMKKYIGTGSSTNTVTVTSTTSTGYFKKLEASYWIQLIAADKKNMLSQSSGI